jgi:hypothetical protein
MSTQNIEAVEAKKKGDATSIKGRIPQKIQKIRIGIS